MVDAIKDSDTTIADDGIGSAEFSGYVDTGCYILNAVISGSLYGGMPDNKVLVLAGESSTGKSFITLGIVKYFLEQDSKAGVVYFDTESAITKQMMVDRGIDPKRVIRSEPGTLQDFRTMAIRILDNYEKTPVDKRPPMLFVLDSLGMLSSAKEIADTTEGKDTRDMTKAQLVRGIFRVLRLKLAKLKVPMIVTSHTYAAVGAYVPTQELSGGGGLKYASDNIVFLTKSKDKDGTEVVGNFIKARMYKSRLSRENKVVTTKLSYDTGLDRWYGLRDLAEAHGIFKKVSTRYQLPDGSTCFGKNIDEDPEKYFTPRVLQLLEAAAAREFKYGVGDDVDVETGEVTT
jgi:RecA/RadA recombinase